MINENRAPLRKPRQRLQRGGETKAQQVPPELLNISRPSSAKQRLKSLNLIFKQSRKENPDGKNIYVSYVELSAALPSFPRGEIWRKKKRSHRASCRVLRRIDK